MLNKLFISGIYPTWKWNIVIVICCWIWFANTLVRIYFFEWSFLVSFLIMSLLGFDIHFVSLIKLIGGNILLFLYLRIVYIIVKLFVSWLVKFIGEAIEALSFHARGFFVVVTISVVFKVFMEYLDFSFLLGSLLVSCIFLGICQFYIFKCIGINLLMIPSCYSFSYLQCL